MQIQLNGEPFEVQEGVTISSLLSSIDVGAKRDAAAPITVDLVEHVLSVFQWHVDAGLLK